MNESVKQYLEKYFNSKIAKIETEKNFLFTTAKFTFENGNSTEIIGSTAYKYSTLTYEDFCIAFKENQRGEK